MIYLDNAATTKPIDFTEIAQQHIDSGWHNPSALYLPAVKIEDKLKKAGACLAQPIGGADRLIYTSCGTESDNLAILKGYRPMGGKKLHFITSAYEHAAVYECMVYLENLGHEVTYIFPKDGVIHAQDVAKCVRADTALVSIMHVNNDTGAINDVEKIAAAVKQANKSTLFHSDGVQGYIKCPINFRTSQIDYYAVSAHKLHGLKGTGVLFAKQSAPLKPHMLGGGQQGGWRSGTENTFGIEVFARAAQDYAQNYAQYTDTIKQIRGECIGMLQNECKILSPENGAPHILGVCFENVRAETLLHALEAEEIYVSTGSACSSKKRGISRTAQAMGLSTMQAEGVVRLSFSKDNTTQQARHACERMIALAGQLSKFIRK